MNTEVRRAFRWSDWPVLAIAGLCAVLALLCVLYVATAPRTEASGDARFAMLGRGVDDVALTDSNGAALHWGQLNGKPRLVFFGFTRCPEICPTTIADLSAALDELGPIARDIEIDFVSVDPERDTPEHLATYFASFGSQFRGLTGERAQIDRVVAAFHAFYEHVPTSGDDYTVNHTAITYLVNPAGEVVDIMGYQTPHDRAVAQLRAFLS